MHLASTILLFTSAKQASNVFSCLACATLFVSVIVLGLKVQRGHQVCNWCKYMWDASAPIQMMKNWNRPDELHHHRKCTLRIHKQFQLNDEGRHISLHSAFARLAIQLSYISLTSNGFVPRCFRFQIVGRKVVLNRITGVLK